MSAHEVEVNLVLFIPSHHKRAKYLDLRNVLDPFVHQVFDDVHVDLLDLVLI